MKSSNYPIAVRLGSLLAGLLLAAALSSQAWAQSIAVTHCQGQCPQYESQTAAGRANVVVHHLYAAGLNGDTGFPDWAAYRLTKDAVGIASLLPRQWQPDRLLRFAPVDEFIEIGEEALRLSEIASNANNPYAGAAALVEPEHRARLVPMTSYANTPYWSELNNLSNMVPMPSDLRRGAWLQLEQRLNRLVAQDAELYVLAGPLYLIENLNVSPSSAQLNPAAYYKVVADESGVAAFVFPENLGQFEPFCAYKVDYRDIGEMTGLTLYPGRDARPESSLLLENLGCPGD